MYNQFSKYLLINIFIIFCINLIFLFITFENPFYSDDYGTIIGVKLYNLINGSYDKICNLIILFIILNI